MAHYFAFGSNMSTARMQERIVDAVPLGRARLPHYELVCNKTGVDGSAKANLVRNLDAVAWGVLFLVPEAAFDELDAFEGGYDRVQLTVLDDEDRPIPCYTYLSDRITADPRPYHWYKGYMLEGATEHGLPADHIARIDALEAR